MQKLIKIVYELFRENAEKILNESADYIEQGFTVEDVIIRLQRNYIKSGEFIVIREGCIGCKEAMLSHPGMQALNYILIEEYLRSKTDELIFPFFIKDGEIDFLSMEKSNGY